MLFILVGISFMGHLYISLHIRKELWNQTKHDSIVTNIRYNDQPLQLDQRQPLSNCIARSFATPSGASSPKPRSWARPFLASLSYQRRLWYAVSFSMLAESLHIKVCAGGNRRSLKTWTMRVRHRFKMTLAVYQD